MENNEHVKDCKTIDFSAHDGLDLRAEVFSNGQLQAARNEDMQLFHKMQVSTDFPVKQSDGSTKWYEESPTKTDPRSGASLLKENTLYAYDEATHQRSDIAISMMSSEYKQANEALSILRAKYTPAVILALPFCKIE